MYGNSDLSKMAPTPALWALLRCTCSPVANRIPSFTAIDRCENDAMRSSFQPEGETGGGGRGGEGSRNRNKKGGKKKQIPGQKFTRHSGKMKVTTKGGGGNFDESIKLRGKKSVQLSSPAAGASGYYRDTRVMPSEGQACKRDELRLPSQ